MLSPFDKLEKFLLIISIATRNQLAIPPLFLFDWLLETWKRNWFQRNPFFFLYNIFFLNFVIVYVFISFWPANAGQNFLWITIQWKSLKIWTIFKVLLNFIYFFTHLFFQNVAFFVARVRVFTLDLLLEVFMF